jgi:hypothetical protein
VARHRTTLNEEERGRLAQIAAGSNDWQTAEKFGLHRATIDRLIIGRQSNLATVVLARLILDAQSERQP